ncbi:MAG: hypothetical protein HND53_05335 [Proteobacteria bacterium]|nr:hypothetical protein [Pseudomonadota bacterium]NOG59904.1 hypothetical protein [Pseudomonadota bacterium]
MDQLLNLADDRLINGCLYCGGKAETRDHVPSRIFLEAPFPDNLPVVGACKKCNQAFSLDEQYLVCLLECVLAGTTDPKIIKNPKIARTLERSPALKNRIETAKFINKDKIFFNIEEDRVKNVMLKLAKGHAAFELSLPCTNKPDFYWCNALENLDKDIREIFNSAHIQQLIGEIGSRNMQRMFATEILLQSDSGDQKRQQLLVNDWIEVQEGYYRYLAISDVGGIVIRIVIFEYLACEVGWKVEC